MAKEICISTTPHETRLAILEDDQLAEIYYERENEYTLAGSIYKGRVTRVLPGMQSSFVDVGLERDAFLYVTDFLEEQEDSEEFGGEPSGRRAAPVRSPEEAQAGEERAERSDRSDRGGRSEHSDRPDRSGRSDRGGRGPERNGERNGERNAERTGGRRPAALAAAPASPLEPPAEPARDSGRAGRERTREQAIAPLREAVPAAQDLEEKGDEESPTGTRRWRGRRGRRRGVRGGLADPRSMPNSTPEAVEEADAAEYEAPAPFSLPEHGAPGGLADLHASPEAPAHGEPEQPGLAQTPAQREPRRTESREGSRERGGRRQREPYAQASTIHRQPAGDAPQPGREPELRASAAAGSSQPTIVLPGESLSKYGSAPADPALTAAPTATVPRPPGRPVNYVAAKPSTLVELSGSWDGGAVLPGETLSRYRGAAAEEAALPASHARTTPAPAIAHSLAPEVPADAGLDQVDAPAEHQHPGHHPDQAEAQSAAPHAPEAYTETAHAPAQEQAAHAPEYPAALAEPEVMAEAVAATPEPATNVPEAVIAHHATSEPVANLPEDSTDHQSASEPAEYEPEGGSASYRVDPSAPRELRIAGPEEEKEQFDEPAGTPAGYSPADSWIQASADRHEPAPGLDEPTGVLADAHPEAQTSAQAEAVISPEIDLSGELEHDSLAEHREEAGPQAAPQAAHIGDQPASTLRLLHEDGSVEILEHASHAADWHHAADGHTDQPSSSPVDPAPPVAPAFEAHGFDLDADISTGQAEPEESSNPSEAGPGSPSDFAEMVDRLQGFAPGHGLLEEETIDEEEYDFEPMHAHADEHDQEDLEEETLDHQMEASTLSDAVRDSYLEQRVHQLAEPQATGMHKIDETDESAETDEADEAHAEAESRFGYVEISEDEDEDEQEGGEPEEGVTGEPSSDAQRAPRSGEERSSRGRSGRSAGGRTAGGRRNGPGRGRSAQTQDLPIISDMLKQGQEILVQIAKEPIAKKGARITSHIALPGRFLVFMPTVSHVGVSRKIASDEERQRLKRILISEKGDSSGGFIVRTAAEGAGEEDLRADLRFLISLWTEIKQRSDAAKAPALIYHDLNLIERILRDQVSSNFSTIWVDSESEYERIIRFLNRFQPQLVRRVKLYTKETPLFEHFGIQEEITKALKSKVWLKSGGSIVINQTEALVAIDINTGKYVGKTARLEDTIVKTNLDAIPEIVRQIRLRDLGGIIVIDFIDMDERKNRNRVLAALEEELKHDRAPSKVLQFNDFGLVAITRKRVKQSLERTLSVTCEVCTGTGMVKSPITVCNEIYIEMRKMQKHLDGKDVMLRVHPEVVKQLKAGNGKWINELEEMVTKTIIIKSDPALHPEQFDIH